MRPDSLGNVSAMSDSGTVVEGQEVGPPPPSEDDWSYLPRIANTLNALEIEIVEEPEALADTDVSEDAEGEPTPPGNGAASTS